MSESNLGFGENYAGQTTETLLPGEMTNELNLAWQHVKALGKLPSELELILIDKAHLGSTLAANMLHLSGVEWDEIVDGTKFEYRPATFHGDKYTKDVRVQYPGGKDRDES